MEPKAPDFMNFTIPDDGSPHRHRGEADQQVSSSILPVADLPQFSNASEQLHALFEASIKGVQSSFSHLAYDDIAYPPHQWFDAALARQIAIHILVYQFEIPKRRISNELRRSRDGVQRALQTVQTRLANPEFHEAYEAMASIAGETIINSREDQS